MTNEEFERRKEFIIEQRAQFAAGMQQLREAQAQTERVVTQTEEIVARCEREMREGSNEWRAKIDALNNSQMQTEEALRKLRANLDRLKRRDNRN
jgi:SMC interacting uncharacterized protein involved in chromosome segregation